MGCERVSVIFKEVYLTNLGFGFDSMAMHVHYTDGGEKLSVSDGMEVQRCISAKWECAL